MAMINAKGVLYLIGCSVSLGAVGAEGSRGILQCTGSIQSRGIDYGCTDTLCIILWIN